MALTQLEIDEIVSKHNYYRQMYSVPEIIFDPILSDYSEQRANSIINVESFEHVSNCPYGENLYCSYDLDNVSNCVDKWMSESANWNEMENNWMEDGLGHFSQVVWRGSTNLGIGKSYMSNGLLVIVCNYYPSGNLVGEMPY